MNLLSNHTAFAVMFLIGAAVVAINAATQFREPVANVKQGTRNPLLDGLPMYVLSGKRSHALGFAIYLTVFEVFYLLLSTSTVLLLAFIQFTGNTGSIGALSVDNNEINPYVPIIASSIVVALSQLKPFNEVEHFIRRVSHRFISSSVAIDTIVDRIVKLKIPALPTNAGEPKDAAVFQLQLVKNQGWSDDQITDFIKTLNDIEFLDAWTDGDQGHIFRSLGSVDAIAGTKAQVDARINAFHERLLRAVENTNSDIDRNYILKRPHKPVFKAEEFWNGALAEAREIKHMLSILLALYLINQPNATKSIEDAHTRCFFDSVQHPTHTSGEYSMIATATTLGASGCFVLFFAFHITTNATLDIASPWFSHVTPSNQFLQSFGEFCEFEAPACNEKPGAGKDDASKTVYRFNPGYYLSRVATKSTASAFWDVCIYGAMFMIAAAVAVAARHPRAPPKEWVRWSREHIPFWQYVSVGAVAWVLSLLLYSVLLFVKLVVIPSLTLDNTALSVTLLADYKNYLAMSSGISMMAFVTACCIGFIHDMLTPNKTSNGGSPPGKASSADPTGKSGNKTGDQGEQLSDTQPCRVFAGFLENHNQTNVDIGPVLLTFSFVVAVINTIVMLNAGVLTSPMQIFNAAMFPSIAFFIIASTYFELSSIKQEAKQSPSGNFDPSPNSERSEDPTPDDPASDGSASIRPVKTSARQHENETENS